MIYHNWEALCGLTNQMSEKKNLLKYEHKHTRRLKRQTQTSVWWWIRRWEITHITGGGELKLHGSSLRQSALHFPAILIAVAACHQTVSAQRASEDNVTNFTKKGTKDRREALCVNETDCRKQLCQNRRRSSSSALQTRNPSKIKQCTDKKGELLFTLNVLLFVVFE